MSTANPAAPSYDLAAVTAIDVHTHVEISNDGHGSLSPALFGASDAYFKSEAHRQPTIAETAAYYRERNMLAVTFTVDAEHATGHPAISNEEIAQTCAEHADVLIPFASIDPHKGKGGATQARRLVTDYGVRGFKFHPSIQGFAPNDPLAYPLYEAIEELGAVALFHTGQTGIGAGVPGGGGIRLKYSNPMLVDDVAVDFPELRIILAHPSFPWQDEALAVATHKPYVHIDLSGWSPKYFPPQLVRYANSLLQDKVLFGSDYPVITPDRWLAAFDQLDIKPEVRPKILKDNAARLLGSPDPRTGRNTMSITVNGLDEIKALAGTSLGTSDWLEITQERVDTFADATGDHQWIHVDPERAKDGPFKTTIAHGYLTLALLVPMFQDLLTIDGVSMGVNYGLDKVRFPAPVPVGSRIRLNGNVESVDDVPGGVQMKVVFTVEIEDSSKPACIAEAIYRQYA